MSFTAREFRDALGLFPTGVAVVTTRASCGYDVGVTINSFTSVSLEPPLVSFNLAKSLLSLNDLLEAEHFAVNLLEQGQSAVSSSFATSRGDKWLCTECKTGKTSSPLLKGSLAVFECKSHAAIEAGDHVIVIGRVLRLDAHQEAMPLLFYQGGYRTVGGSITSSNQKNAPEETPETANDPPTETVRIDMTSRDVRGQVVRRTDSNMKLQR